MSQDNEVLHMIRSMEAQLDRLRTDNFELKLKVSNLLSLKPDVDELSTHVKSCRNWMKGTILMGSVVAVALSIVFGGSIKDLPRTIAKSIESDLKPDNPNSLVRIAFVEGIREQLKMQIPALVEIDKAAKDARNSAIELAKLEHEGSVLKDKLTIGDIKVGKITAESILVGDGSKGPRIVLKTNPNAKRGDWQAIVDLVSDDGKSGVHLTATANVGSVYLRGNDQESFRTVSGDIDGVVSVPQGRLKSGEK